MISQLNSVQTNNNVNFTGVHNLKKYLSIGKIKSQEVHDIVDIHKTAKSNTMSTIKNTIKNMIYNLKSLFIKSNKKEIVEKTPTKYYNYITEYTTKYKDGSFDIYKLKITPKRHTDYTEIAHFNKHKNLTELERHFYPTDCDKPIASKLIPDKKNKTVTLHMDFNPFGVAHLNNLDIVFSTKHLSENGEPFILSLTENHTFQNSQNIINYKRIKDNNNEFTNKFYFSKEIDGRFCTSAHDVPESSVLGSLDFSFDGYDLKRIKQELDALKAYQ